MSQTPKDISDVIREVPLKKASNTLLDISLKINNLGDGTEAFLRKMEADIIDGKTYYAGDNPNYPADRGWYASPPNPPFSYNFTNPVTDPKIGKRLLIEYITAPLLRYKDEILDER